MCSTNAWGVTVEEEFKKNPMLTQELIDSVMNWVTQQPHLPKVSELDVIMFLRACEFNIDQTKETIEAYYTYRTALPDFFSSRDPTSKEIQDTVKVVYATILPQCDPNGNWILWGSLVDPEPSHYSFNSAVKYFVMTSEVLQLENGTIPGIVVVYDVKHVTLSHIMRTPLSLVSKYAHYAQEGASFPVRGIHYLNASPVLDKLTSLVKPILKSNVLDAIHIHTDIESLFKFVPKDIVPKDYGGNEQPLKDLNDINIRKLESYQNWFIEEEKQRVDESKRITEKKTAKHNSVRSLQGTFKKLELD